MSRLSILLAAPTLDQKFEDSLASVLQHRPDGCPVVVATAGRYDDPYHVADEAELIAGPTGAGLVELANLALPRCQGDVVNLLAAGVVVEEGWWRAARCFDDFRVGAVAPRIFENATEREIAGATIGPNWTRELVGRDDPFPSDGVLAPLLQCGFFRTEALVALGGFAEDYAAAADLDMALSLAELDLQCIDAPQCWATIERIDQAEGYQAGRDEGLLYWRRSGARASLFSGLGGLVAALGRISSAGFARAMGRLTTDCLARRIKTRSERHLAAALREWEMGEPILQRPGCEQSAPAAELFGYRRSA